MEKFFSWDFNEVESLKSGSFRAAAEQLYFKSSDQLTQLNDQSYNGFSGLAETLGFAYWGNYWDVRKCI